MRHILKLEISFLVSLLILLTSCFKNGLEEDTSGMFGTDGFYQNESDMEAAIVAVYNGLYRYANPQVILPMYGSDDVTTIPGSNKADFRAWDLFDYSASAAWLNSFAYKPYWDIIYRANTVLMNLDNLSEDVSGEFKDEIEGQAKFMRGFAYFNLVRIFGGMPIIKEIAKGDEPRGTVLETYELIENDLKEAAVLLPEDWGEKTMKATSGAAHTVLADLYLTWAGWPLKDADKYQLAADEANMVIQSGTYHLLDNYGDLWPPEADFNDEDIFEVVFSKGSRRQVWALGASVADESGWIDIQAELSMFKRMPKNARFDATYYTFFQYAPGGGVSWENSQYKLPTFKKWQDGGEPGPSSPYEYGERNVTIYRYAEVLLTFAEASAMAKGAPGTAEYNAVNEVRKRANGGVDDPLPASLSLDDFRDSVLNERGFELAGEFDRWHSLVRTETLEYWSGTMRDPDDLPLKNQPTKAHYISPIPQAEIDRSGMTQNPEGNILR